MKKIAGFINQTLKGGIFFMFPLMITIILLEKFIQILRPLTGKLALWLDPEDTSVIDFTILTSILIILFICFLFGLMASSGLGTRAITWLEVNLITKFPGYQMMKNNFQSVAGIADNDELEVVLVPIDGWMIAFKTQELETGEVLVYVPGSPDPWSGNLVLFHKEQIKKTNLSHQNAVLLLKKTGVKSADLIQKMSTNS